MKALEILRNAIREQHAKGLTDMQIAEAIGDDRRRVCQFRRRMGLKCNLVRQMYSKQEYDFLRQNYGKMSTATIAKKLKRTTSSIYQAATRIGLSERNPHHGRNPEFIKFVKECHSKGWSDAETAAAWGCERHCVCETRKKLGIPHNALSEHRRRQIAKKTKEQLRKAGLPSLACVRTASHRKLAREHGWPEDLKPRQVQILELLWKNGPMTKMELGRAMGLKLKANRWHGPHYAMICNNVDGSGANTSYTGDLLRRGLIISLGRVVRNKPAGAKNGQGHNTVLYSLPLTIERKPPTMKEHNCGKAC